MTIQQKIKEDMKTAMKAKDKATLTTIRMVLANVKNQEIDTKTQLTDEAVLDLVRQEIKNSKDSIAEGYGKEPEKYADKIKELQDRIQTLETYLPTQLTQDELEQIVKQTITEVGATSKAEMGKVMAALMPKVKGIAEGKVVNQTVGKLLV